ncbi:sugar transferase [Pseudomonadota bacterium]
MIWKYFVSSSRAAAVLLTADVIGLFVIFNLVHNQHVGEYLKLTSKSLPVIVMLVVFTFYIIDGYRVQSQRTDFALGVRVFLSVAAVGGVIAALAYLLPEQTHAESRATVLWRGVLPVALLIFAVWASTTRVLLSSLKKKFGKTPKWLVVGGGAQAANLASDYATLNEGRFKFLRGSAGDVSMSDTPDPQIEIDQLSQLGEGNWSGIVIVDGAHLTKRAMRQLMDVRLAGVRVYDAADFYEKYLYKVPIFYIEDEWFALSQGFDLLHHRTQLRFKGLLDKFVAVCMFVLCLPLFAVIPLLVKRDSRGPAIYSQARIGKGGREFVLYKFRTMQTDAEEDGPRWAQKDDPRVTRVGRMLRKARLDELPQLWNVLKGDMSFIGPRPERRAFVGEIEKSVPYYELRHLVRPGITGWAQVMYPYGASIADAVEKLQYDLYYIKNYSLLMDAVILIKTMRIVFHIRGR